MLTELLFGRNKQLGDRSPLSDFWYSRISQPVASKVEVDDDTALTYSAVWAATRLLSSSIGRLPLNLYKRRRGGGRDIQTSDRRHKLVHLKPNRDMTAMMFRSSQAGFQINGGNCYAEIQWAGNMPLALWPIHPSRVMPMIDDNNGMLVYKVHNNAAEPSFIPAKDMLHVPSMMSVNGITGMGVIHYARESIGFGIATERHGASFFGSGAIPRIVIKHPKTMSPDARKTFRQEWKEIYGGPTGDDVALLSEGAEVMPINISNEDSQFLETRKFNIEEIARWYNIPQHMLGSLEHATFSNIEHQAIGFVRDSLVPWLKLWEQALTDKLLTEAEQEDYFFEFEENALLRGDSAARAAYFQVMLTSGVYSLNEVRELEGFNRFSGGDTHYIQGAMAPIGPDGMLIMPVAPEPEEQDEPEDDEPEDEMPTDEPEEDEGDNLASKLEEHTLTVEESIARLRGDIAAKTPVVDTSEIDKREEMLKVSARMLLGQAAGRIVRKHAQAARRASKNPKDFLAWNDTFAEKNQDGFVKELEPCLQAFSAIGIDAQADGIVSSHLTMAHEELLEASGSPPDLFVESIEACVSNWEECRAQSMADSVYELTINEPEIAK